MTDDTHTARIAMLRALREKATQGEWRYIVNVGPTRGFLTEYDGSTIAELGILARDSRFEPNLRFIAAAANEALPLLSDLEKRIEELELELVFVKSHHTARYVVTMTQENETLKARLEAAEAENRKLREALEKYADESSWRCLRCERSDDSGHRYEHDQDVWEHLSNGPDIAEAALADKGGESGA